MRREITVDNLFLNISTVCDINCRRCYSHLDGFRTDAYMELSMAQRATELYFSKRNEACPTPYVMLFCGEPLLNWNLVKAYVPWVKQHCRAPRFTTCLFTNGLALDPGKAEFLLQHEVLLFISLDGDYESHSRTRPISREQYDDTIACIQNSVQWSRGSVIPYCVFDRFDRGAISRALRFIASLGVSTIAVTKNFHDEWNSTARACLAEMLGSFKKANNVEILVYPEFTSNCFSDCAPTCMMVYPNGDIYDLCYVCTSVLREKGLIDAEQARVMHMGNVDETEELHFDSEKKRQIVSAHMYCPTVGN